MTIPVSLPHLAETVAQFGSAILVTLPTAKPWARVLVVDTVVDGEEVVLTAPHPAAFEQVAANDVVTLVWAAQEHHGFSLIVDGWARVDGGDIRVTPDHAVLHRPGAHSDGPEWKLHR